ncbi:DUF1992 domain-containing protein [Microbacterium sulfonylureivorans]|uniref:DnaJ family domain-containing protein n=1 Tax=Microbacterium sulfonylureivorans TaxID=2486854 RepID=UPI000FD6BEEE|nr:DUF1992 domain-containing protein [Microbacterium sulfonylureivorans]
MTDDPRVAAARYREELRGAQDPDAVSPAPPDADRTSAANAVDRAAYVETAIQQAIRRGEFDDLPGAGKPIPGLGESHDPDWWIRRKIEREQLSGLGPPALMLRVEAAEFAQRLDALSREAEVRDAVDDFNRRVVEARRQLQGGPPVVTPTRDADAEVAAWAERRDARARSAASEPEHPARRRRWWGRAGRG